MSSAQYDFYRDTPVTKEHVLEYLRTWLKPISPEALAINGEDYIPVAGFRRGSCIHTVYRSSTGEYFWYVAEDTVTDYTGFPTLSNSSYDGLITDIVQWYCRLWDIRE